MDEQDTGTEPRVLFYLDHAIQDATIRPDGARRVISRQMQFVEQNRAGESHAAGFAPYLDYQPLAETDQHSSRRSSKTSGSAPGSSSRRCTTPLHAWCRSTCTRCGSDGMNWSSRRARRCAID